MSNNPFENLPEERMKITFNTSLFCFVASLLFFVLGIFNKTILYNLKIIVALL
jgi:hypothetical protein